MKIISVTARRMYGYLDLDANFNEDLSIIVGINGTGKTSVINVIEWLTKPDFEKLKSTDFERISLIFEHERNRYRIHAEKSESEVLIGFDSTKENFEPLYFSLSPADSGLQGSDGLHHNALGIRLAGIIHGSGEMKFIEILKGLPEVTVVSLQRLIKAEVGNTTTWENIIGNKKSTQTPVDYVQNLFQQRLLKYRQDQSKSDEALRHSIMMAAISSPNKYISTNDITFSPDRISELKAKISQILNIGSDKRSLRAIDEFFDDFHQTYYYFSMDGGLDGTLGEHIIKLFNQQIHRVYQIAGAVSTHDEQRVRNYSDISRFIKATNKFLSQTGKYITVDSKNSKLGFVTEGAGNSSKKGPSKVRALSYLSSGEMQIVVLFGLLSFSANRNSVFIVDEPEVSLHPHWQNTFMESFVSMCPDETQLIVATHSPEMVAGNKTKCIVFGAKK